MNSRSELRRLWADKVAKLSSKALREILSLPRGFTCWHYRKGLPIEEMFHRSLTVDRATNDTFRMQYWSYEWDGLVNKVVRLSKKVWSEAKRYDTRI